MKPFDERKGLTVLQNFLLPMIPFLKPFQHKSFLLFYLKSCAGVSLFYKPGRAYKKAKHLCNSLNKKAKKTHIEKATKNGITRRSFQRRSFSREGHFRYLFLNFDLFIIDLLDSFVINLA